MDWDGDFKQSFPKNKDLATSDPIETNGSAIKNDDNQNTLVEIYLPLFFYTQKKGKSGAWCKPSRLGGLQQSPEIFHVWNHHQVGFLLEECIGKSSKKMFSHMVV